MAQNRKGLSRGFAFVEMDDKEAAESAVDAVNGLDYEGRTLSAKIVPPRDSIAKVLTTLKHATHTLKTTSHM